MLGIACLTGQTTGASAGGINVCCFPVDGRMLPLFCWRVYTLAAIVSFTRVSLPEPELLRGKQERLTGLFMNGVCMDGMKRIFESSRFSRDNIRRSVARGRTGNDSL